MRFYRGRFRDWVALRGTTRPVTRMGRAPRNCADARYLAVVWRSRSFGQRRATERWLHDYAWWLWMPSNWQDLGACETGYGRRPGNFNHANSRYVSAFGISRVEYDSDAAYFDAAPWNDDHPPTPRDQLNAARGHLARFGDGWGCPGP